MKSITKTTLVIIFVLVVAFLLLFGEVITSSILSSGIKGNGWMEGTDIKLTPSLLSLCLGFLLGWLVFSKKK